MVAVNSAPLFANDFPLDTTAYPSQKAHDAVAADVIGAEVGSTVTVTRVRLPHSQNASATGGGLQQAEVVTEFNRETTEADVTKIEGEVIKTDTTLNFPRDLSGNGGPAFNRT